MSERLDWKRDGADWPNRAASRFVTAGGVTFHVQMMGEGPVLLLLHGTGAATHSWRDVLPALAADFTLVAPDLPGHGFSSLPAGEGMSLPGMAAAVAALLGVLGVAVVGVVGHSAGAAIAVRMVLDRLISPRALVSLNGALLPLPMLPEDVFGPMARALVSLPLVPRVFAWQAGSDAAMARLLGSTGSVLDARGQALYARLVRSPGHVAGALSMMAHWGLRELAADLPRLVVPLTLIAGAGDRTVPPGEAHRVKRLVSGARVVLLPGLGHLAHEERPGLVVGLIREAVA